MKLLYVEVLNCSQEPDLKTIEEHYKKLKKDNKPLEDKIRYLFDYKITTKETLDSGKEYIKSKVEQGKSKIILKSGLQFLEISDGAINNNYWFCVEATHQKIGK